MSSSTTTAPRPKGSSKNMGKSRSGPIDVRDDDLEYQFVDRDHQHFWPGCSEAGLRTRQDSPTTCAAVFAVHHIRDRAQRT